MNKIFLILFLFQTLNFQNTTTQNAITQNILDQLTNRISIQTNQFNQQNISQIQPITTQTFTQYYSDPNQQNNTNTSLLYEPTMLKLLPQQKQTIPNQKQRPDIIYKKIEPTQTLINQAPQNKVKVFNPFQKSRYVYSIRNKEIQEIPVNEINFQKNATILTSPQINTQNNENQEGQQIIDQALQQYNLRQQLNLQKKQILPPIVFREISSKNNFKFSDFDGEWYMQFRSMNDKSFELNDSKIKVQYQRLDNNITVSNNFKRDNKDIKQIDKLEYTYDITKGLFNKLSDDKKILLGNYRVIASDYINYAVILEIQEDKDNEEQKFNKIFRILTREQKPEISYALGLLRYVIQAFKMAPEEFVKIEQQLINQQLFQIKTQKYEYCIQLIFKQQLMKYFFLILLLSIPNITIQETMDYYQEASQQLNHLIDITPEIKLDCLKNLVHIDDGACQQVFQNAHINTQNCLDFPGLREVYQVECENLILPSEENCLKEDSVLFWNKYDEQCQQILNVSSEMCDNEQNNNSHRCKVFWNMHFVKKDGLLSTTQQVEIEKSCSNNSKFAQYVGSSFCKKYIILQNCQNEIHKNIIFKEECYQPDYKMFQQICIGIFIVMMILIFIYYKFTGNKSHQPNTLKEIKNQKVRKLIQLRKHLPKKSKKILDKFMSQSDDQKLQHYGKFLKNMNIPINPFQLKFKDYVKYLQVSGNKFFKYPKSVMKNMSKKEMQKGFKELQYEINAIFSQQILYKNIFNQKNYPKYFYSQIQIFKLIK